MSEAWCGMWIPCCVVCIVWQKLSFMKWLITLLIVSQRQNRVFFFSDLFEMIESSCLTAMQLSTIRGWTSHSHSSVCILYSEISFVSLYWIYSEFHTVLFYLVRECFAELVNVYMLQTIQINCMILNSYIVLVHSYMIYFTSQQLCACEFIFLHKDLVYLDVV